MTDDTNDPPVGPRPNPRPVPPSARDRPAAHAPRPVRARPAPPVSEHADPDEATVATRVTSARRVLVGPAGATGFDELATASSVFDLDAEPEPIEVPLAGEWARLPRRGGWLRRALVVVLVFGLIAGFAAVNVNRWLKSQIYPPGDLGAAVGFTVPEGQSTNAVANDLAAKNVVSNATVFRFWVRRQGSEQTFQAGVYDLRERMDFSDVLAILRAGPKPPVQLRVTIPPGLSIAQMKATLLAKLPGFDPVEFDQALVRPEIGAPYARTVYPIREGLLIPDTYNLDTTGATNEYALFKRMRDQMDRVLNELNAQARADALGVDLYDVLKVASLIEKEAKVDADRPKIARVIYNRLARNMSLGIDASTRYAVGKTNGEPLTVADLASDHPYNTRKVLGLPPSPIANPGRASIDAALSPTPDQAWLYYVLTDEGGVAGAHTFANTAAAFETARRICVQKGYCD